MEFQTIATLLIILVVIIAVIIVFVTQFGQLTAPQQELSGATQEQSTVATGTITNFCASDAQCDDGFTCVDGQCVEGGV